MAVLVALEGQWDSMGLLPGARLFGLGHFFCFFCSSLAALEHPWPFRVVKNIKKKVARMGPQIVLPWAVKLLHLFQGFHSPL